MVAMPYVRARTGNVFYEERGSGAPLVLLHANGHSHHDFDDVAPALSRRFRTIAVDWPGCGASDPPDPASSASAKLMSDVLQDVVVALGLEDVSLIGNSVGGYAAARLAIDRPEIVRSLVLVDSGGFTKTTLVTRLFCAFKGSERVTRWISPRFARFYTHRRPPLVVEILAQIDAGQHVPAHVAVDAALWRSFPRAESSVVADAGRIACPTLLVWGAHDRVSKAKVEGRAALAAIPGSRLVTLDTGHVVFAEAPEEFLGVVEPFLEGVSRDAGSHAVAAPHF